MNIDRTVPANFPEGIVLVSNQGLVERINIQAEILLSISHNQAVGQSIIDVLDGQVSKATLADLIGKFHHAPTERAIQKSVKPTSLLTVRCDALQDASGQATWLITLSGSPFVSLSSAFFAAWLAKKRLGKITIITTGAVLIIATTSYVLPLGGRVDQALPSTESGALAPIMPNGGIDAPQTQNSALSIVGTIEAGDTLSVTAPFDAVIKEKKFSFDVEVRQNQLLLTLDTTELINRLQETKVAMLKAARTLRELENWEKGTEVARAQRNSVLAQQQVEQTERKAREAETLLNKGIIPRSEYDGLVEQLNGYKSQLAAALDDLRATREKAHKSNREIALIEHAQAQAKYKELSASLALEKIAAPRTGIIAKAPATSGHAPATLEAGSRITKGQLLFNISSTENLRVSAKVDEADIVDLAPGMKVAILIDSQDMPAIEGRLVEIAAQAAQNGGTSRSAAFDIKIEIPKLDAQQRRRLRIGMTCNVSVVKGLNEIAAAPPAKGNPL
jgi:multidrug resistance efflux pump